MNVDPLAREVAAVEDMRARAREGEPEADFYQDIVPDWERSLADKRAALDAYRATGDGTILKCATGDDRWVILLPDASVAGKYRYQNFDRTGFTSHGTRDTPEEVAIEVGQSGYTVPDPGRLDQLAETQEWIDGTAITGLIAETNAQRITYDECLARIRAIRAHREAGTVVARMVEAYETGVDGIVTMGDVADRLDAALADMDPSPATVSLRDAVDAYRVEQSDNFGLAGRGDMDAADDGLMNAVTDFIGRCTPSDVPRHVSGPLQSGNDNTDVKPSKEMGL